jgi:pyruvate/2-oxoglutarate dehydrogenase complex dihydrolipoamide dehydrogenase (E3) component
MRHGRLHAIETSHRRGKCRSQCPQSGGLRNQCIAPAIDGREVMDRLRRERDAFVAATQKTIAQIPARTCVKGKARFVNQTTLAVDEGSKVFANAVVIATGARPSIPKMFEGLDELLLTNETIFELRSLPRSIAIVGAGPLGLELAQALARLGVRTSEGRCLQRRPHPDLPWNGSYRPFARVGN